MPRTKADLAKLSREYAENLINVVDRLAGDDGTLAAEDLKALEAWHAMKVHDLETQLRAEGVTEADIGSWRAACRDQITLGMNRAEGATF
jgi:hypothetical protein